MYYTGSPALSNFRLEKLLKITKNYVPTLTTIKAQYLYFVDLKRSLSETEEAQLRVLLPESKSSQSFQNEAM